MPFSKFPYASLRSDKANNKYYFPMRPSAAIVCARFTKLYKMLKCNDCLNDTLLFHECYNYNLELNMSIIYRQNVT